ncbi:Uncharacterised protein [uncultured archaeon]|nr:Uncharacterised protein [uncultured archaeon]
MLIFEIKRFILPILLCASIMVQAFPYASPFPENLTSGNYGITINSSVSPITVTTDRQSYDDGSKILISGSTRDYVPNTPITVIIRNPLGNVVMIAQLPLSTDKTYSTMVTPGGTLWHAGGTYEVDVTFGNVAKSAKTTFKFSGSKFPQISPNLFSVDGTNFTVQYDMTNGNVLGMKTDSQSKSLLVAIQTTNDGVLTLVLPRALIDAKAGNQDNAYFVLLDEQEADFSETNTTSTDRTLSIPFVAGTEEIEIMGTQILPEFGPPVSLIFAIALLSIIVVTSKIWSRFILCL